MKNVFIGMVLTIWILFSVPAWSAPWSSLFDACDAGPRQPKPDWVSQPDYSRPGYYSGVGAADRDIKNKDEQGRSRQSKASEEDAKQHLVQQIRVTIRSENEQSTRVNNQGVQKEAMSKVTAVAEEELRDLQIKGRWVDQETDTCTLYTLMEISKASIERVKLEKIMKERLGKFKPLLAEGFNREKNRNLKTRLKYLEEAQALLNEMDFSVLPEEVKKEVYVTRLNEALEQSSKEASQVRGRMALFAINQDGKLRADLIGKILDKLRSVNGTADRLMAECITASECIDRARERGFSKLALLNASSQVVTSPMGSRKGTLKISRTVYDIDSGKVEKGPDIATSQVIGWSDEELDWESAAEKALQDLE